jgi:hypothetical protein
MRLEICQQASTSKCSGHPARISHCWRVNGEREALNFQLAAVVLFSLGSPDVKLFLLIRGEDYFMQPLIYPRREQRDKEIRDKGERS